jgi:lysophospholipase L1-like esterase
MTSPFPGQNWVNSTSPIPVDVRTAEELIHGYRQLISRSHARGVKVIGATISPFEGTDFPGYYSESKDATRQALNHWIRSSGSFDDVVDFDAALRDPDHPSRLLPQLAFNDHLHPNDDGYCAMANAVDIALLK